RLIGTLLRFPSRSKDTSLLEFTSFHPETPHTRAKMSRYAQAHVPANTKGPGDARPTAIHIVQDEGLTGKLNDKVFVVTGVSSGIGIETMRALYSTGGHVFGTVRNIPKGQAVVDEITSSTKGGKITLIEMSMDDLASVKKGAEEILSKADKINVVINNAGIMAVPEGKTKDGFEMQFGTNHVGHFYLFQLLKDTLLKSATPEFPSRVVSVSSFGHRMGEVRFDDYNFERSGSYDPWASYGQAKTANIYFSNEIERRYGSKNLHSTSLHPGGIWTGLQDHLGGADGDMGKGNEAVSGYMKSPAQGAATSVYAALSAEWANKGGRYLSNCVEEKPFAHPGEPMYVPDDGYETWAYDEAKEGRLWTDSLKMVGVADDQ
ncbi:Oxidoreductase calI, partial [Pseudocercospora fuligena]